MKAVVRAADDVGKKFVDQQVYAALRSPDYRSILKKIGIGTQDKKKAAAGPSRETR